MNYKRKLSGKLTGEETFINSGKQNITVANFWRYGFSNLNSNILRGVLAEFLVECAVNGEGSAAMRSPWEDYDVLSANGTKIEVKCSSYLQDWDQNKHSQIVFGGLKAKSVWDSSLEAGYKADVYVFAVVTAKDPRLLNLLDLKQWDFYVLNRDEVASIANGKSRIVLNQLIKQNISPVAYEALKGKIEGKNIKGKSQPGQSRY